MHAGLSPLAAALITTVCLTAAAEPPRVERFQIEQPAQPMADALRAIARTTKSSVLFDPVVATGLTASPLSGRYSAAEAIERVLEGSGLVVELMGDGAIVVRLSGRPARRSEGPVPANVLGNPALLLAQAGAAAAMPASPSAVDPASRVEITGSRLQRVDAEGALPINVYSREAIERSGASSVERFLSTLNEAAVAPGEGVFGTIGGQGSVQLRGLPVGSTLVLINGRRVQAVGSSAGNIFNLNLIPLAAVERIEIVPVGSSAVYGGDALAGVVNIILRDRLDGHSLSLAGTAGQGFGSGSLSVATGRSGARGGFTALAMASRASPLLTTERGSFFSDADYRRLGGRDVRVSQCTPGTVSSATGGNLPGLNASIAGIPDLPVGTPLTVASFAGTAGTPNLCSGLANGYGYALTYESESHGVHASGHYSLGQGTLFGELTRVREQLRAEEVGLLLNNVLVPASNPYNPFGEAVRVTARLGVENGSEGLSRRTDFTRMLIGMRGPLAARWDYELTASSTRDEGLAIQLNNTVSAAARTAALASSSPELAINPFTSRRAASEQVLRGIWSNFRRENEGSKDQVAGFVRGVLLDLPAGPLDAIVGAEWARDRYSAIVPGTAVVNARRSDALYGELRAPLLRADVSGPRGWTLAALTLAGRRDSYDDFGAAETWQAGLELRPVRSLLLRASTASSFKPPTLLQTTGEALTLPLASAFLTDPARGGATITSGELVRSSNPGLRPESGEAYAVGAVWAPEGSQGTRLGITAWRVRIDGLIALLAPQLLLDNEGLFGLVTRGPAVDGQPGPVTRLIWSEVNFGRVETAGIDIEAEHAWRGRGGRWTVAASATRASQYDVAISPGRPAVDRLGRRFSDYWAPRWKARVSGGFERGGISLGLTSRYLGSYLDAGTSARRLGGYMVHDLNARVDLRHFGLGPQVAKAAALSLAVVNLSDRLPQFAEGSPYFDVSQGDWRGRHLSARLSLDW